jgi:hypothetical protein
MFPHCSSHGRHSTTVSEKSEESVNRVQQAKAPFLGFAPRGTQQVDSKGEKSREAVRRVYVPFQNIEGEIVETTEAPDGEEQQTNNTKCGTLKEEQNCGEHTQEEEEEPFRLDPSGIGQILDVGHLLRMQIVTVVAIRVSLNVPFRP